MNTWKYGHCSGNYMWNIAMSDKIRWTKYCSYQEAPAFQISQVNQLLHICFWAYLPIHIYQKGPLTNCPKKGSTSRNYFNITTLYLCMRHHHASKSEDELHFIEELSWWIRRLYWNSLVSCLKFHLGSTTHVEILHSRRHLYMWHSFSCSWHSNMCLAWQIMRHR